MRTIPKKHRIILLSILFSLSLSYYYVPSVSAGLGILPGQIVFQNCLKGLSYYDEITILNTNGKNVTFDLNSTGDIHSWVTFYSTTNITYPLNVSKLGHPIHNITIENQEKILVNFTIPINQSDGSYNGTVYAKTVPPKINLTSGGIIVIRLPVMVNISVTGEQILQGNVTRIATRDVEVNQPLVIEMDFMNAGNVIARPVIDVNITREGYPIDSFRVSNEEVAVASTRHLSVDWNTSNHESGNYHAKVTVTLGGTLLANSTLPFTLYPRGTFTRKGELSNLSYQGTIDKNNVIKIIGTFTNTGPIETSAKLIVEIYKDSRLIDIVESPEELKIDPLETHVFSVYYQIRDSGRYTIHAYAAYENNQTAFQSISFEVNDMSNYIIPVGFIVALLCIVSVSIVYIVRQKKIKKLNVAELKQKETAEEENQTASQVRE